MSSSDPIDIVVRNVLGLSWQERWTKDKLAYLILMTHFEPPKFQHCMQAEWVPFDDNEYKWDKHRLSFEEFEAIAAQWPGREPVPFDARACDHVQFSYRTMRRHVGVGFDPTEKPILFDALLRPAAGRLRYEEFFYWYGRHFFLLELTVDVSAEFLEAGNEVQEALRRIDRDLPLALKHAANSKPQARFSCRHGSFEPPFQFWHEV